MVRFINFPDNYQFIFTIIFGDTPRVRIIEFFIVTSLEADNPPWTYISQISRILNLSKSSVKNSVDSLINEGFLIEKKIQTHQQNPQRNVKIQISSLNSELTNFYKRIKDIL